MTEVATGRLSCEEAIPWYFCFRLRSRTVVKTDHNRLCIFAIHASGLFIRCNNSSCRLRVSSERLSKSLGQHSIHRLLNVGVHCDLFVGDLLRFRGDFFSSSFVWSERGKTACVYQNICKFSCVVRLHQRVFECIATPINYFICSTYLIRVFIKKMFVIDPARVEEVLIQLAVLSAYLTRVHIACTFMYLISIVSVA